MTHPDSPAHAFDAVVQSRRSIRGFKPQPVSRELLDHIFHIAQSAPSNCNTQPWFAYVVSGARRDGLANALIGAATENRISMDYPYAGIYAGVYRDRQWDAAQRLNDARGIARENKALRLQAFMRNYEFFGAPHVVFLCMPDWCGLREAADVGMYAQTLMLTLTAHGLGSCPQTALGMYADVVREFLQLPADQKVLFGISFGYADDSVENAVRIPRASIDTNVTYLD
jgi:nitroreductase